MLMGHLFALKGILKCDSVSFLVYGFMWVTVCVSCSQNLNHCPESLSPRNLGPYIRPTQGLQDDIGRLGYITEVQKMAHHKKRWLLACGVRMI